MIYLDMRLFLLAHMKMKVLVKFIVALATISKCICDNICCIMPQWEGSQRIYHLYTVNGTTRTETGISRVAFDATNIRIYTHIEFDRNGTTAEETIILDYMMGLQYNITNNVCYKTPLGDWEGACIRDSAKLLQKGNIGFGSTSVPTTTYQVTNDETTAYVVVTKDCIPIGGSIWSVSDKGAYAIYTTFFNFTLGVRNTAVFEPPLSCFKATVQSTPSKHSVFETFRYFD